MKKTMINLAFLSFFSLYSGQTWNEVSPIIAEKKNSEKYYSMDLNEMRSLLKNANEIGKNTNPIIFSLPTLEGKIERFAIYSRPVVEKSMADRYGLGSYVGLGLDDPEKYVRFSISPNDFQSMIIKNGEFQYIEPMKENKGVFAVLPPSSGGKISGEIKNWCGTEESPKSRKELQKFIEKNKADAVLRNSGFAKRASDRMYRNYRIAISVNGEYTQYFGGKPAAAAAINATMTAVNGLYEKEMAVHFTVLDIPDLIYEDPNTDPYNLNNDDNILNLSLQKKLTEIVGNDNYDIGHLFLQKDSDITGSGLAAPIGGICINPIGPTDSKKGAAHSKIKNPQGHRFNIGVLSHEIGHQLGANHIYSYEIYYNSHVEPGSGSTIMGYAGITPNANVQDHTDAYFNAFNIAEIQSTLSAKNCGSTQQINNMPPIISPMLDVTIPKGTPFILTASASDPNGDSFSYNWEQEDSATEKIITTTGNNFTGPIVRSRIPVSSPVRYIPKFDLVMNGILTSTSEWESVPHIARDLKFKVTTRDNNVEPQTSSQSQKITVGNDGPFRIISNFLYTNIATNLDWDVANTNMTPYSVDQVKIDYTTDNGTTWNVLSNSTPNDGTESIMMPSSLLNQPVKVRISAQNNIFYTVGSLLITQAKNCDGSAPNNLSISDITISNAHINWEAIQNATYIVKYKKQSASTWIETPVSTTYLTISGLEDDTQYEVQVAAVCAGSATAGAYSSLSFKTLVQDSYCIPDLSPYSSDYEHISNVTVGNMSNPSGANNYTNYSTDPSKTINLIKGSTGNIISISKAWANSPDLAGLAVWIDFNRNGIFESSEKILSSPGNAMTPVTATFDVPSTVPVNKTLRMRVAITSFSSPGDPCADNVSEVEDYAVKVVDNSLHTDDLVKVPEVKFYPNPVEDFIRITSLKGKALYQIHNAEGRLITSGAVKSNNTINVTDLIKGIYVLTVEDDGAKYIHKFIKK